MFSSLLRTGLGPSEARDLWANSLIAATNGWPIGRIAGPDEDTILYADIDIMQSRTAPIWNQLNDLFRDRRTDLYDPLLGYRGHVLPR